MGVYPIGGFGTASTTAYFLLPNSLHRYLATDGRLPHSDRMFGRCDLFLFTSTLC